MFDNRTASAESRAAAGIAFLDQHDPGWRESIRVGDLDIRKEEECALGQRYGSFAKGQMLYVDVPGFDTAKLGFYSGEYSPDEVHVYHADLTAAWKKLLAPARTLVDA